MIIFLPEEGEDYLARLSHLTKEDSVQPQGLKREAGGAEGIRTPYLLNANQAFSQLNYGPVIRDIISNIVDVIK